MTTTVNSDQLTNQTQILIMNILIEEKGDDDTQDEDSDDTLFDLPQATILQETYVLAKKNI